MTDLYKIITHNPADVVWEDDSFASGWAVNPGSATTDGDIYDLLAPSGSPYYANAEKQGLNVDASVYKYLIACFKGSDQGRIYVYDGSWHQVWDGQCPTEYDVKIYDLSGITTGTITQIAIRSMTADKHVYWDFLAFTKQQPQSLDKLVEVKVHQRESDIDEFEIIRDGGILTLGHHIRIWLNAIKVFAGVIEESTPEEGGILHASGRCFEQKLLLRTKNKNFSGREVSLAVKDLVEDLSEISTYGVETPSPTVTVTKDLRYEYIADGLKDFAKQAGDDWEVKLGMGHDLRFRSRVSSNVPTSPVTLEEGVNVLKGVRRESDALRLFNKVTVIGGARNNPDNDPNQYTDEDASSWVDDDLHVTISNDYANLVAGKASIKRYGDPSYTIAAFNTKIDLGSSGVNFSYFTHVRFYYETSGISVSKQYNFYIRLIDSSGRVASKIYLDTGQSLLTSWVEYDFALSGFSIESGFDWEHIRYIQMQASTPPPAGTISGTDWWDRLCFYTNNIIKTEVDSASDFKHTREYVYKDEKLVDPDFVQEVADALLAILKSKENRYRILVKSSSEIQVGQKISVNIPSHSISGIYYIAEVEQKVTPQDGFITEVILEKPRLSLEGLLAEAVERKIRLIERGGIA